MKAFYAKAAEATAFTQQSGPADNIVDFLEVIFTDFEQF